MNALAHIAEPLARVADADQERASADQLRTVLAASRGRSVGLTSSEGETADITLSPAMTDLLLNVLRMFASGDAVVLMSLEEELTTQQAADMLNVSRPHFVKLLEDDVMPFTKVGRHRRVRFKDVLAYKEQRDQDRASALDELAKIGGDLY